jgi:hypothetical protein
MKQTLEEATKNWITKNSGIKSLLTPDFVRESFIEGAKWQRESYNEFTLAIDDLKLSRDGYLKAKLEYELKQQENSYSEEDMNNYAEYCTSHILKSQIGHPYLSVTEWLEQFKK